MESLNWMGLTDEHVLHKELIDASKPDCLPARSLFFSSLSLARELELELLLQQEKRAVRG
jgi:hypothetical protein